MERHSLLTVFGWYIDNGGKSKYRIRANFWSKRVWWRCIRGLTVQELLIMSKVEENFPNGS
jgi:flagellar biosynthesis regulator FlaF